MLQVVMTANAFVVSFMAMPFSSTANTAALRFSAITADLTAIASNVLP